MNDPDHLSEYSPTAKILICLGASAALWMGILMVVLS